MGPQILLSLLGLSLWTAVLTELPGGSMKSLAFFFAVWATTFLLEVFRNTKGFRTSSLSSLAAGYRGWEERLWSLFSLCKPAELFKTKHRGNTRGSAEPKEVGKSARGLMSDGIGDVSETWSSVYLSEFRALN